MLSKLKMAVGAMFDVEKRLLLIDLLTNFYQIECVC